jgi:hypothetical protein
MTDRLTLAHALEEASIERGTAEKIATEIYDAIAANVATKQDLMLLEQRLGVRFAEIDTRFSGLENRINGVASSLENRINGVASSLENRINGVENRILVRVGGMIALAASLILAGIATATSIILHFVK